jgi:hypothetical protein
MNFRHPGARGQERNPRSGLWGGSKTPTADRPTNFPSGDRFSAAEPSDW